MHSDKTQMKERAESATITHYQSSKELEPQKLKFDET